MFFQFDFRIQGVSHCQLDRDLPHPINNPHLSPSKTSPSSASLSATLSLSMSPLPLSLSPSSALAMVLQRTVSQKEIENLTARGLVDLQRGRPTLGISSLRTAYEKSLQVGLEFVFFLRFATSLLALSHAVSFLISLA